MSMAAMKRDVEVIPPRRRKDGTLEKGFGPPVRGRAGKPNKTTRILKECILLAAEAVGEDGKGKHGLLGYLKMIARREPKAFVSLLGRVLPLQIAHGDGDDAHVVAVYSREELVAQLEERGLPTTVFEEVSQE